MKVKKIVNWFDLSLVEKAGYIGKKSEGFYISAELETEAGCVLVEYSYSGWDFSASVLIAPLLDSGFAQILEI